MIQLAGFQKGENPVTGLTVILYFIMIQLCRSSHSSVTALFIACTRYSGKAVTTGQAQRKKNNQEREYQVS